MRELCLLTMSKPLTVTGGSFVQTVPEYAWPDGISYLKSEMGTHDEGL